MTETSSRVCGHCGAPLRELVDGFCPYCRTRPFAADVAAVVADPATAFSVLLVDAGRGKIQVIKALREIVQRDFSTDLGLKEAKDIVDRASSSAPPALIVGVDAFRAQEWADTFSRAGAVVEIRPPIGAAPPPTPGSTSVATSFGVFLIDSGSRKINVIKEIRELTNCGLKEAKDLADAAGNQTILVLGGLSEGAARQAATRLAAAGAVAEVRPV